MDGLPGSNQSWEEVTGVKGMNCNLESAPPEDAHDTVPTVKSIPISVLKQNGLLQTFVAKGPELKQEEDICEDVLQAEEEWEAVEILQSGTLDDLVGPAPLISFNEALQYFQTADLSDCRKKIQPTVRRTGLSAISHFLFGPPRLHRDLQEERDLALAIAQCSLDTSEKVHMRVLQTVYKKLTGSRFDCPRFGTHWEHLGFQGLDPATDLRATGLLGLMHTLYLVMDTQTLPLAREIFKLSQHETQNFPFCVMSINITRIVIQALREECLSKECNRRQQVIAVLNDFYVATYLHLYHIWKTQNKTISDSGFVLKEVEMFAKRNPKQLLRRLESHLSHHPNGVVWTVDGWPQHPSPSSGTRSPSLNPNGSSIKQLDFTGVCDLQVDLEGEDRLV
ncbi:ELMO domain-containing protein 3 isoform X2 [Ambystoma mexicanum]|uniref:ELMO domain-containing protein 3 isoform X2 n=1 Tax=Ambystoma mexicanum TaxID=8296 RepID=UPI0037E790F0